MNVRPINISGESGLNLMTDSKTSHYLVDLDLSRVADLGIRHEDYKSLYPGNAIAFPGNVLNADLILFSNLYRSSLCKSARGRFFLASKQSFTILAKAINKPSPSGLLVMPLLNPFAASCLL